MRVAQAGVIAGRDIVHDALESPAAPPQPTAGLIEVRRRRTVLLVPGERPLMSTHASILVDSVGPPSAEVCRTAADRKSTRLNSSHITRSRMPSSA